MGFYVYRKFYMPQAKNYGEALDLLREAEEKGILKDFFISTWAKDEKDVDKGGWVRDIKKQLGGGK
ncbi:MAG: hypothetical protein ACXWMJ_03530 [Syntrophales bacterium]